MLGISVYLSDVDTDYIRQAAKYGVKYIFTSLHIPEENLSDLEKTLPQFIKLTQELGVTLIPDISPYTFEKLGLRNNDFAGLRSMGFDLVRLDFGFEDVSQVYDISKHFNIVLNASLVDDDYLKRLEQTGLNMNSVYLMHNFYPRQDTGLNDAYFNQLNEVHQKYPIQSMVFVVGDLKRRLPLYEGLPTLERHRDVNPYVAGIEFFKKHNIDMVFIGDNQAKIHNLKFLHDYINEGVISLPVQLHSSYQHLYDTEHGVRQDQAVAIIRLAIARVKDIEVQANNQRKKGSIVIDNRLAGRYSGEVQLIQEDMVYSSRSNNIGWVHPEYVELLNYIDHTVKVRFIPLDEVA